jgi:hypothetical protein
MMYKMKDRCDYCKVVVVPPRGQMHMSAFILVVVVVMMVF